MVRSLPLFSVFMKQVNLRDVVLDRVFVHALNTVKRIPRTGTARPPTAERLKLYGLYKQSMGMYARKVVYGVGIRLTGKQKETSKESWTDPSGIQQRSTLSVRNGISQCTHTQ